MNGTAPSPDALEELLAQVCDIARRAGQRIMEVYRGEFGVETKADSSPVTEADLQSEKIILQALQELTPELPAVSEEAVERGEIPNVSNGCFWLVDPLDGTREFVNRRDEFTVNIGLVDNGAPILGVVGVPAQDAIYAACGPGTARFMNGDAAPEPIAARRPPAAGVTVVASRSHGDKTRLKEFLEQYTVAQQISAGSAVKLALVAKGEADLYPRFGRTMEWDTAAGHAILIAAGGSVRTVDDEVLRYGKPGFENPPFVAYGLQE